MRCELVTGTRTRTDNKKERRRAETQARAEELEQGDKEGHASVTRHRAPVSQSDEPFARRWNNLGNQTV
jgi:hypothetical protein